ncbi:MAG: hypothetical protein AAB267_01430 [Candidatus Desantisbacteria bacterium]
MLKKRQIIIVAIILIITFLGLSLFILRRPEKPPLEVKKGLLPSGSVITQYFPELPILSVYTSNLTKLIADYQTSKFQKGYIKSKNYAEFQKSKLYLKLKDKFAQLGGLAGFGLSLKNLKTFFGNESILFLYDIGELKIVFSTKISRNKLSASVLYNMKSKFEERRFNNQPYYVKESDNGRLAFAFAQIKDTLVISNDVRLFMLFLACFTKEPDFTKLTSSAFSQAFGHKFTPHNWTLYLHNKALDNRYFRNYWIFKNYQALSWINEALIDVEFKDEAIIEQRIFNPKERLTKTPCNLTAFLKLVPKDIDYSSFEVSTDANVASIRLVEELFPKAGTSAFTSILERAKPEMIGRVVSSRFDKNNLLLGLDKAIIIKLAEPKKLNQKGLKEAILSYYQTNLLATEARLKFNKESFKEIYSLELPLLKDNGISFSYLKNLLILSNSKGLCQRLSSQTLPKETEGNMLKLTTINLRKVSKTYLRLMEILFAKSNWIDPSNPSYFKENIGSLLDLAGCVDKVTIEEHLRENRIYERAVYY